MRFGKDLLNSVHRQVQRGAQIVASISGGAYGGNVLGRGGPFGLGGGSTGEGIDFAREIGQRFDVSCVFAVLAFAQRNMQAVPLRVYRLDSKGKAEVVPDHPISNLLARPNPWYPGLMMEGLQIFAECGWGNSYCYRHRDRFGRLKAFEFMPVGAVYPYTWPGTGEFISTYYVSTPNGYFRVPPDDILHLRYALNAFWPAYGKSPLEALFPEIAADRMASRHEAAILDNQGVSNAIVSPKQLGDGTTDLKPVLELTDTTAKDMEDRMREKLSRDGKGSVFFSTYPIDFNQMQFNPEELNLTYTHDLAEQRICACFGFQPGAIGFGTGLREQNNRASAWSAIEFSIDQGLIPYMQCRAAQLTFFLDGEVTVDGGYLRPGEFIMYDLGEMPAIKRQLLREMTEAAGGPIISINDGRSVIGRESVPDGDVIRNAPMEKEDDEGPDDSPSPRKKPKGAGK